MIESKAKYVFEKMAVRIYDFTRQGKIEEPDFRRLMVVNAKLFNADASYDCVRNTILLCDGKNLFGDSWLTLIRAFNFIDDALVD